MMRQLPDRARNVLASARFAVASTLALAQCIEVVNRGAEISLEEALALEAAAFGMLAATSDMREGTSAFLEKRTAAFRGE